MDKNVKTQEIIVSLDKILSELDEKHQDIVAIRIAEAISDLSQPEPLTEDNKDI